MRGTKHSRVSKVGFDKQNVRFAPKSVELADRDIVIVAIFGS
jgi:hypothetical protein